MAETGIRDGAPWPLSTYHGWTRDVLMEVRLLLPSSSLVYTPSRSGRSENALAWLQAPPGSWSEPDRGVYHSSGVTPGVILGDKKPTKQGVAMAKGVPAVDTQSISPTSWQGRPSAKPQDCGSATL